MSRTLYAFMKPSLDVHTLGVTTAMDLLRDCGYQVIIGDGKVSEALNEIHYEKNQEKVVQWLIDNDVTRVGLSYRLDPDVGVNMVGYFVKALLNAELLFYQGGPIETIFFGGLLSACERIQKEHKGLVATFTGGESVSESLVRMNVPKDRIPYEIIAGSRYDDFRLEFGKDIIDGQGYQSFKPIDRSGYEEFGTMRDSVEKRIERNLQLRPIYPLIRAHSGPFDSNASRLESVQQFVTWSKYLAASGYLDILSIGSSQLTQSNFGEDWGDHPNGGGVPINRPEEYRIIWESSRPLLLRTYAGTKNIPELAVMHEKTLNICWHALSLWWFNKMDGRGPYDLYMNLQQHFETIRYISTTGKPFEGNVPHHFAFRGADDVTYIVSAYLAAKLAKTLGVKTYVLQNMLNTPRSTWGVQDLAKSRALLALIKGLEGPNFKVILQPRAGLDYFKPDLYEARIQLAAVTALMDDIEPHDESSPPIIHVVSYSEAVHLATPEIIDESIRITLFSLQEYRRLRKEHKVEDMAMNSAVSHRMQELLDSARIMINGLEKHIPNLYTPEGFYLTFVAGFLPTPYLWDENEEYRFAKHWKTKLFRGGTFVVDKELNPVKAEEVLNYGLGNLSEAQYALKKKRS